MHLGGSFPPASPIDRTLTDACSANDNIVCMEWQLIKFNGVVTSVAKASL